MQDYRITKNLKDLEYNKTLGRENILLVLIGTSFISIFLTPNEIIGIGKIWLIGAIIAVFILSIIFFDKKLRNIEEEIRNF